MHLKFSSEGRGRRYSRMRGAVETTLDLAYHNDWPARLWGLTERSRQVRIVRVQIEALDVPPLRIAFASDLHIGPTTAPHTLDRAFELLAAARPDVLLLGGDYVFLRATPEKVRELRRRVESVRAPCTLAVLGNHDLWTNHDQIENALQEAGAHVW